MLGSEEKMGLQDTISRNELAAMNRRDKRKRKKTE